MIIRFDKLDLRDYIKGNKSRKGRAVTYEMKLNPRPFEAIKSGRKTVEMRLNDPRRKDIKAGDYIRFTHTENGDVLLAKVIGQGVYQSFEELYLAYDKTSIGYLADEVASHLDMLEYYTEEQIKEYGALAIEIKLI